MDPEVIVQRAALERIRWFERIFPPHIPAPLWTYRDLWLSMSLPPEDFTRIYPLNNHCEPIEATTVRPHGDADLARERAMTRDPYARAYEQLRDSDRLNWLASHPQQFREIAQAVPLTGRHSPLRDLIDRAILADLERLMVQARRHTADTRI